MTRQEEDKIFDKFLLDNKGKKIERVDPNAYAQCFDLAIFWCEYLGFPKTIFSGLYGANEIYNKWSSPLFDKVPNTPDYVPLKGDIVVWSGSLNGGIGHVSVATGKGDVNYFESFDQNWVVGSPSVLVSHSYDYVLGAQRLKVTTIPMTDLRTSLADKLTNAYPDRLGVNNDSTKMTEIQINAFVEWVKSNVARASRWDQLDLKAFGTGHNSSATSVDDMYNKIKALGGNIAALKTKIKNFIDTA